MSQRSTTDVLTNHTMFSAAELHEHLPALISSSQSPPSSILPTFLHEATHHWCFTSLVGTAIAILQMRGTINAFRAIEATTPQEARMWEERAADDIVRSKVASLLLQPLAEGMATFAEFDLSVSMRSPAVPSPLRWAIMFGARDKLTGSSKTRVRRRLDIAQLTGVNILSARMSEKTQRAKEALLCQPLSCQEGGGYLAGYMLIKSLWRFMQIHDERFAQPEVFLLKVYEIFYEDTEFVRLLLDQSQSIPEALGPLASHLLKRTNYAFSDVKESLHEYYDALVEARSHLYRDENEEGRVLPFSDLRDLQPTQRFLEIWEMVMGSPITSLPKNSNDWYNSQVATLAMHMIGIGRDLLELGSLPAQLSTEDAETNVLVNGHTVTRLPTISGVPMGQNGGNVHVFLNTRNGDYVVVAVSDELMPIAIQKTSEAADIDDVSLYRTIMGRIQGVPSIQRLLSDSTDDLNQLKELTRLDGYLKQTRERLDGIYPMFATIEVPVSALEELIPKMMVDGIYGAFDYDADLVRALAIIGSMAHVHLSKETLAAKFEKQGLDFGLLLDKLRMYSEATNLFLIRDEFGFSSSL